MNNISTAEKTLKEYFYNNIIKHPKFELRHVEEIPSDFDDLIEKSKDFSNYDWYYDYNLDDLEIDYLSGYRNTTFIYKIDDEYISIAYNHNYKHDFQTCKFVKPIEVTTREWVEIN